MFVSDALHFGPDWDLILGLCHGHLDNLYTDYKRSANSPTVAAVFRAAAGVSVYASYVEALEEGSTAPDTVVNAREVFPPLVSK